MAEFSPESLPWNRELPAIAEKIDAPHGTTIVCAVFADGVIIAGDRRVTMGSSIAHRQFDKVFPTDDYSAIGIAGSAGTAVEIAKLFQLELEHYQKVDGAQLSLAGKANRLSTMIRANLAMAMQGLVVVPIFAGFDLEQAKGRIFTFDVTGGRTEETGFAAVGSGSVAARGAMKKLYREGMTAADVKLLVIQALYDAADEDSATGGLDFTRNIYPLVGVLTEEGYSRLTETEVAEVARSVQDGRAERPDGPQAPLR